MAITNRERVGKALELLTTGLCPFVERELKATAVTDWFAETLSKAKNTALNALTTAGVVKTGAGKARLLRVDELPRDWPACRAACLCVYARRQGRLPAARQAGGAGRDPATDKRLTVWEMVHHLIRVMNTGGETGAAELVAKLGSAADAARELAYRLYSVCERRKRAAEALAYNALVQSWPEISRPARDAANRPKAPVQGILL